MSENQLYGNATKKLLRIPQKVLMGGYIERIDGNAGVHDELYTRCAALYDGKTRIVIISNDLLEVDMEITQNVRNILNDKLGVPCENIMLCSTHTHSGPAISEWDFSVRDYIKKDEVKELKKEITQTIIENALICISNLEPVNIECVKSECSEVACNRVRENGVSDCSISTLVITDKKTNVMGLIVNYACHPTVLGADNIFISGDFPGALAKKIDEHFIKCTTLFINGACGNQSTRFTRKGQDFKEVDRMGSLLYDRVIDSLSHIKYNNSNVVLDARLEKIMLPSKKYLPREDLIKNLEYAERAKNNIINSNLSTGEKRLAVTKYQGALISLNLSEILEKSDGIKSEIQIFRIGNIEIIGMPVELFVEYGIKIKSKSHFPNVIIAGYANEVLGYVYTRDAAEEGGYEVYASPFSDEAGEVLVNKVLEMERTLF